MTTGKKIERVRRKTPGISQERMAEKMGISTQSYYNKINGKSSFKMKEVEIAAQVLQVPIDEFRENEPVSSNNSFQYKKGDSIISFQGLAEQERMLYERLLKEKDEENKFLRSLLKGAYAWLCFSFQFMETSMQLIDL